MVLEVHLGPVCVTSYSDAVIVISDDRDEDCITIDPRHLPALVGFLDKVMTDFYPMSQAALEEGRKTQPRPDIDRSFGDHVRYLRKRKGLNTLELAEEVRLSPGQVSGIERGKLAVNGLTLAIMGNRLTDSIEALNAFIELAQGCRATFGHEPEGPPTVPMRAVSAAADFAVDEGDE